MNLQSAYSSCPFSIKKGCDFLWQVLHLLSLPPSRITTNASFYKFPKTRECQLLGKTLINNLLEFEPFSGGSFPVREAKGSIIRLFNSSLRYSLKISSTTDFEVRLYSHRAEFGMGFFPAVGWDGRPLEFSGKKVEFFLQGIEYLIVSSDSKDLELHFEALAPRKRFDRIPGKKCITDGENSTLLYELIEDDYFYTIPSEQAVLLLLQYKRWFFGNKLQFIPFLGTTLLVENLEITFVNEARRSGSYHFIPNVLGDCATYDDNGVDIGISVPLEKRAVITIPELYFVYSEQYKDDGDWEFSVETGSVDHLFKCKGKSFALKRQGDKYSLPVITLKGLPSFSFSVRNSGLAEGIERLVLGEGWSINFV